MKDSLSEKMHTKNNICNPMEKMENGMAGKSDPVKNKSFSRGMWKYFTEYSEVTGIQGIRYTTEKRSIVEKVFWIIILLMSLSGCIYMIFEILDKYNNSPIIVTFSTKDTPVYNIPFPAVTICFESKYSRENFNYSGLYDKVVNRNETENLTESMKLYHMRILCGKDGADGFNTTNEDFYDTIEEMKMDNAFVICWFEHEEINCEDIFIPRVLDLGLCYSFNIFGRHEIFRKDVWLYSNYHQVNNNTREFFDVETGYKENMLTETYPRRSISSGLKFALTLYFKTSRNNTDPACNVGEGIRVSVHNPWDVPQLTKQSFYLPFNKIVRAAVEPEITETSDAIRNFSPEKRNCFMRNERPLKYFQEYSQDNCLLECYTNYTLSECGCVKFYMPRHNDTPICGGSSALCASIAERTIKFKALEYKANGTEMCYCRASCTNLRYNVVTTENHLNFEHYSFSDFGIKNPKDYDWSLLQVFFKDEQFMTKERSQLYGISDLISQLGGLLGLFTGFSLVTVAEIIYFCSMRICCNIKLHGDWSGAPS